MIGRLHQLSENRCAYGRHCVCAEGSKLFYCGVVSIVNGIGNEALSVAERGGQGTANGAGGSVSC
jgi:hypothetical protein